MHWVVLKSTVCTSQETHYVSATEPNRLMLYGERVAVYCENRAEHAYTAFGQTAEFPNYKQGGILLHVQISRNANQRSGLGLYHLSFRACSVSARSDNRRGVRRWQCTSLPLYCYVRLWHEAGCTIPLQLETSLPLFRYVCLPAQASSRFAAPTLRRLSWSVRRGSGKCKGTA
jgi:hypothetical protein